MSVLHHHLAGSTGIDEPPGITALIFCRRACRPPARAAWRRAYPSEPRSCPAGSTSPDTEKILVPPLLGLPSARNASAAVAQMIHGTAAKVSVLLMVVGLPYRPKLAGNGGLKRGWPFLPSSDSSSAGFLAADVGAEAVRRVQVEGEARCPGCSCPAARRVRLVERLLEAFVFGPDLAMDVVVAGADAHGDRRR